MEYATSEPLGSDPDGSEPGGSEPDGSDPDGSEPDGSEPDGSEPEGSDPDGSDPLGSEPEGSEPEGRKPVSSDPDGREPLGSDPEGSDPLGRLPLGSEPLGRNATSAASAASCTAVVGLVAALYASSGSVWIDTALPGRPFNVTVTFAPAPAGTRNHFSMPRSTRYCEVVEPSPTFWACTQLVLGVDAGRQYENSDVLSVARFVAVAVTPSGSPSTAPNSVSNDARPSGPATTTTSPSQDSPSPKNVLSHSALPYTSITNSSPAWPSTQPVTRVPSSSTCATVRTGKFWNSFGPATTPWWFNVTPVVAIVPSSMSMPMPALANIVFARTWLPLGHGAPKPEISTTGAVDVRYANRLPKAPSFTTPMSLSLPLVKIAGPLAVPSGPVTFTSVPKMLLTTKLSSDVGRKRWLRRALPAKRLPLVPANPPKVLPSLPLTKTWSKDWPTASVPLTSVPKKLQRNWLPVLVPSRYTRSPTPPPGLPFTTTPRSSSRPVVTNRPGDELLVSSTTRSAGGHAAHDAPGADRPSMKIGVLIWGRFVGENVIGSVPGMPKATVSRTGVALASWIAARNVQTPPVAPHVPSPTTRSGRSAVLFTTNVPGPLTVYAGDNSEVLPTASVAVAVIRLPAAMPYAGASNTPAVVVPGVGIDAVATNTVPPLPAV